MSYPVYQPAVDKAKQRHKDHDAREAKSRAGRTGVTQLADGSYVSVDAPLPPAEQRPQPPRVDPKKFLPWKAKALPNSPAPASMAAPAAPAPAPAAKPAYDPAKAWARVEQSRQEADRVISHKVDQLNDLQARTKALQEQYDPRNRLVSGGSFPKLVDLLGDTGPALRAMKHLDEIKTSPAVIYQDRRMTTSKALALYTHSLLTMGDAIIHIAKNSSRDLTRIVQENKAGLNHTDVLSKAQAELAKAEQAANDGKACFKQQPPAFVDGMNRLRSAVRLNQAACEEVTGWSDAVLSNAEANVAIAVGVRDFAVGALVLVAVGALTAPVAIVSTVVGGATVKTALHASDFIYSGKPVPWSTLTAEFVTDVVFSLFGKWFEEAIKPLTAGIPESWAGALMAKHGVSGKQLVEEVRAALSETQGLLSEQAKKFVESLMGERTKAEEQLTTGAYFEKRFREIFTEKRFTEVLTARLKDHLAGLAAQGTSQRSASAPRTVDAVAGSE